MTMYDRLITWAEFYKTAVEETLDFSAPTEKKKMLLSLIEKVIKAFSYKNFQDTILGLSAIKEFVISDLNPEILSPEFANQIMMDENIWDWVDELKQRKPNKYDIDAAKFVVEDLVDMLDNNNVFAEGLEDGS